MLPSLPYHIVQGIGAAVAGSWCGVRVNAREPETMGQPQERGQKIQ